MRIRWRVGGTVAAVLLPLAASAGPAPAQTAALADAVKARVTPATLDSHARGITRHERPSGSAGENAAIDYIVRTLEGAGVPVDVHEFPGYTSDPLSASVTVPGTGFAPRAITMSFSGATDGVEAVAVDLGDLGDLPDLELGTGEVLAVREADRFAHVRGKVAVVTGQPRNVPTVMLEQLGAVAVVFVNPEERLNDLIVTSTWGTPSLLSYHRLPTIATAQITRSAGDELRSMMRGGEVRVRVRTEVEQGWTPLRIAVARIMPPGAGDETPYLLFGGHIDAWYHGATDEGASNAAMLDLAMAFHANRQHMRRGLVVAWWPGHSNARYGGSTWFADNFFEELRTRGVGYFNVDGIGQIDARRFGATTSPAYAGLAAAVMGLAPGRSAVSRPGRNSDQAFNGIGLPLFQINQSRSEEVGGYWWWHTPDDTYDKIDAEVLEAAADLYADAIAAVVASPTLPVDLVAEVAALRSALQARERESGGALDLGAARRRAEALTARFAEALTLLRTARSGSAELDRAVLAVLRPIHRVMFVPGSDHHPDPGLYGSPLPGLEPARILAEDEPGSDRHGFAMASLVRERNRVLEALAEAEARAGELLELLRGLAP